MIGNQKSGWGAESHPLHKGKAKGAWPPFEKGNIAALKSGATRAQLPADDVATATAFLFGPDTDDWPLAARRTALIAAEMWVRRQRALDWCDVNGYVRDDGSPQPVLTLVNQWESKLLKILEQHGGTPMAAAQLTKTQAMARALQRPALAAALDQLDALEAGDIQGEEQ